MAHWLDGSLAASGMAEYAADLGVNWLRWTGGRLIGLLTSFFGR